jgi:hypothetical protein
MHLPHTWLSRMILEAGLAVAVHFAPPGVSSTIALLEEAGEDRLAAGHRPNGARPMSLLASA